MDLQLMKKVDPKSYARTSFVTSNQDFHIEFPKSVIDLKKFRYTSMKARIISKRKFSSRNGRTGVFLSTREPPVQNGRVVTYVHM